jgi:hypothetical protein
MKAPGLEGYMTLAEFSQFTGLSVATIYRLKKRGELSYTLIVSTPYFTEQDWRAYLKTRQIKSKHEQQQIRLARAS